MEDTLAWEYDWIIIVGFIVAFLLAISVGANDVANPFGTSVGSGALTLLQCFVLATLMETLGAMTMGGAVSDTIRKKIVDVEKFNASEPTDVKYFMIGQLSAMFGAAVWQILASIFKMPVSGTHSIVGAVVGFALIAKGPNAIQWKTIFKIIASWFISPLLSGIMAISLYFLVSKLILQKSTEVRVERAFIFLPIFYSVVCGINVFSILHTMNKIYKWSGGCDSVIDPVDLTDMSGSNYTLVTSSAEASPSVCFEAWHFAVLAFGVALAVYIVIRLLMIPNLKSKLEKMSIGEEEFVNNTCVSKIEQTLGLTLDDPVTSHTGISENGIVLSEKNVENIKFINEKDLEAKQDLEQIEHADGSETKEMQLCFKNLQAFSACFDAFAHGGNDVGNSIGPVLALYSVAETCKPFMSGCNIDQMNPPQSWIISIGCAGIVLGLWTLGKRVIKTVGKDIAKITPARGFAIDIMAGFTVLFGSMLQIPLSTTHCKVGAVVAVSLVHDRSAVSMSTFRSIILAWGVTLPVSGAISALAYTILKTFV